MNAIKETRIKSNKPQNKYSEAEMNQVKSEVCKFLREETGLPNREALLLGHELVRRTYSERVSNTATTAAEVHFSSTQKIEQLVEKTQNKMLQLDESEELEPLLIELLEADAEDEGNSL